MSSSDLTFERFRSEQVEVIYGRNWTGQVDKDVIESATAIFCWRVMNALHDIAAYKSIQLSRRMKSKRAHDFILYGVARRLLMMWYSYRSIILTAPSKRTNPLSLEESRLLAENLNSIYINIRGTMDNLSWALLSESPHPKARVRPALVALFEVTREAKFESLAARIEKHRTWYKDFKTRRDPAAHQFPPYVPPQGLTGAESKDYSELYDAYVLAASRLDFESAETILKKMELLGSFTACFVHDPDQNAIPIYPTLPNDVGHLIDIFGSVDSFVESSKFGSLAV